MSREPLIDYLFFSLNSKGSMYIIKPSTSLVDDLIEILRLFKNNSRYIIFV